MESSELRALLEQLTSAFEAVDGVACREEHRRDLEAERVALGVACGVSPIDLGIELGSIAKHKHKSDDFPAIKSLVIKLMESLDEARYRGSGDVRWLRDGEI